MGVEVFVGVKVGVVGSVFVGEGVFVGVELGDEVIDGVGLGVTGTLWTCAETK